MSPPTTPSASFVSARMLPRSFSSRRYLRIKVQGRETNLVNFLYNVGNDPAMIRVRELDFVPANPAARSERPNYLNRRLSEDRPAAKPSATKVNLPGQRPATNATAATSPIPASVAPSRSGASGSAPKTNVVGTGLSAPARGPGMPPGPQPSRGVSPMPGSGLRSGATPGSPAVPLPIVPVRRLPEQRPVNVATNR